MLAQKASIRDSKPRPRADFLPSGQTATSGSRVREALRIRHYSRRTEEVYVAWIRRYLLFHDNRHPAEIGGPEVTRFRTALAVDGHVAGSTQNQALLGRRASARSVHGSTV